MVIGEKRRVIAVVADAFAPFHREVLDGLRPHFSAAGFGTLAVTGRDVRTDRLIEATEWSGGDHVGGFGSLLDVRGAVVVCGATPPGIPDEAVAEYIQKFADGPVVSFGIMLPGVPSLSIAWDDAIEKLMAHMATDPHRRRFAFVRGFAGDPHSEMREAGFRAGLAAAGIPVHEELIVNGNYSVADALNAVDRLLSEGHHFDSLVAANDDMAVGAIGALNARGLRVPDDVIVAGFDDSLASFVSEPPLTTVLLDTPRLTAATADLLLDAIATGQRLDPDLEIQIPSGLIVRSSTGHVALGAEQTGEDTDANLTDFLRTSLVKRWEAARAPDRMDIDAMAGAAVETMLTGNESLAKACAESYQDLTPFSERSEVVWLRHAANVLQEVITEMANDVIPEAGLRATLEQLAVIDKRLTPIEKLNQVERQAHRQLQERLVMRLAACSDTASLWSTLRTGLRSLGMEYAWVAANEPTENDSDVDTTMRLLFSLGEELNDSAERFPRAHVLPRRFGEHLEEDVHVLVPLRAGVSDIGYMVVEPRGEYLLELEAIASGIAQVLRNLQQVEDLEHRASRLRLANEALDQLNRRDSLTGLANRKFFLERLDQEIVAAGEDEQVSVLFLDLDGFKGINDTLGHEAGDHLLRVLGERLGTLVTAEDTLARLGGDEFTVLIRHQRTASRPAELARRALEAAARASSFGSETLRVSASIGIAHYPDDGMTGTEIIRNADAAMYVAKASGKNAFAAYSDGRSEGDQRDLELSIALRLGIDNKEFELEYQPRIDLATGDITAFEALLRWKPSGDIAEVDRQPDRFIALAERNGLIHELDAFSLDGACRQARHWAETGHPVPVSVNMSVKRLQENDIVAQVERALGRHSLAPELLELEVSEQALMIDVEATTATLRSLREIGVRCSIDDYGVGASSIADLVRFPVDIIKIDQSLIERLDQDTDAADATRATVAAIVSIGTHLSIATVAEGVETDRQRRELLLLGCQQAQGFVFSKSLAREPAEALLDWQRLRVFANGDQSQLRSPDGSAFPCLTGLVVARSPESS